MLWESNSSGKVAGIEGNVCWKSCRSKKVALQEEKSRFLEHVALLKKLMLCRSTCFDQRSSSVDIFILSNYSTKIVAVPKNNCPKELPILTKWLLGRNFVPKNYVFWKNNSFKEMALSKTELLKKSSCSEEIEAPKE